MFGRKKNPREGEDVSKRKDGFDPVPPPDPPPADLTAGDVPEFEARKTRAPVDGDDPLAGPGAVPVPGAATGGVGPGEQPPPDRPQPGQSDPEAAKARTTRGSRRAKAEGEPTTFKFCLRNTWVQCDGSVRATSADEAKDVVAKWILAGLEVREG
jgi:hypothetical protein